MNKNETVCAVVVTFNRKELLIECLESLKKQTRSLDAVYIIDNASTDGTPELLLENEYIDSFPPQDLLEPYEIISKKNELPIHYVRMHENTGGAGGFNEGIKRAYDSGYDWFWLMDDDGFPSSNCLDKLLTKKQFSIIGPLVMNNENNDELSFQSSIYKNGKTYEVTTVEDLYKLSKDETIPGVTWFFNGSLISKFLVEKIGYPRKEFFLWGDEAEYFLRAKKYGFDAIALLDAHYYHPINRVKIKSPLKGLFGHSIIADDLKSYCYHRNYYHIKREYWGYKYIFSWIFSESLRRILLNDWKGLKIVLKAWHDGLLDIWGNEKKFIK